MEAGRFRQDLLFRINVVVVDLPPLRMRGNDILLLAQHFPAPASRRARAGRCAGCRRGAAQKLLSYRWPGNVRELQNCMERAVALAAFEEITVNDLPAAVVEQHALTPLTAESDVSEYVTLEENERRYIARVLEAAGGNKSMAARILGVDRKTLWRKLDRQEAPEKTDAS